MYFVWTLVATLNGFGAFMSLRKPQIGAIAVVAIAMFVAIVAHRYLDSRVTNDNGRNAEQESTQGSNEFVNEIHPQEDVQGGVSSNADGGPSLGKFDTLTIPVREPPPYEHPDVAAAYAGDPAALFGSLVKMGMAGNAVASYNLYGFLVNCNSLYKTEEELEVAINRMYETRSTSKSTPQNVKDRSNPEAFESNIRQTFSQCRVVPAESIRERDEWLRRASEDGLPLAIEEYANSIARERPGDAFSEYNRLWGLGGAIGAFRMSEMLATGWEGQEPDLVTSAAYGFIATEYIRQDFESIDNKFGSLIFEEMKRDNVEIQRNLLMRIGPGEFDQAFEIAQDLLSNNPNCCFN